MTANSMKCELFSDQLMAYLEHEVDEATRSAIERHSVTCTECGALLADLRKIRVDAANLPVLQPSRDLWSGIAARIQAPVLDITSARQEEEHESGITSHTVVAGSHRRRGIVRRWMRGALIAASLVAAAGLGYAAASRGPELVPRPVAVLPPEIAPVVVATVESTTPAQEPVVANPEPNPSTPAMPAPARPTEVQLALATLTADYDREIAKLRVLIDQRRNQLDPATVEVIEKNLKVIDTAIEDSKKAIARDPASRFLIESLNQSLQTKVELMRTAALLPSRT